MADVNLSAKKREITTKGSVNQMRKDGLIPGVFYSKGIDPLTIAVDEVSLKSLVFTSETHMIHLKVDDNEPVRCILKDVQFDPVSDRIIHFDLYGVTAGQQLQLQVPLQIVGSAIGVKEGGQLQVQLHKLDIECLPKNIPDHIQIDVTNLNIGDSVHAGDISMENIKVLNPEGVLIVTVAAPKGDAVEDEAVVEEIGEESSEPEVINKGKSEEE